MPLRPDNPTIQTRKEITIATERITSFLADEENRQITIYRRGVDAKGDIIYDFPPEVIGDLPITTTWESQDATPARGRVTIAHSEIFNLSIEHNGRIMQEGIDYNVDGNTITFTLIPDGEGVNINYAYNVPANPIFSRLMRSKVKDFGLTADNTIYDVLSYILWTGLKDVGVTSGDVIPDSEEI